MYYSLKLNSQSVECGLVNRVFHKIKLDKMSDKPVSDFHIGMKFQSFNELETFIKNYENANFVNLKIRESRKIDSMKQRVSRPISNALVYYEITYICYFGPQYRKRNNGLRDKRSLKRDCPFKVTLRVSIDGESLEVRTYQCEHNHSRDSWIFSNLPSQRKIDLNDKYLSELIRLGANKKLIQVTINKETGMNIPLKSLHNIKKLPKVICDDVNSVVQTLKNDYKCTVSILTNESNVVCGIFFMDQEMLRMINFFPELLMIDATYKLLDSR